MPRFFAEIEHFPVAVIHGRDSVHHIAGPLRKRPGDELAIRIGITGYRARITSLVPDRIRLEILDEETLQDRSTLMIHLAMCLIDFKDFEETIRSATELGVSEIFPVVSARSNIRGVTEARRARWESIILEAVKQCDRKTLPLLHQPMPLDAFLSEASLPGLTRLFAHKDAPESLQVYRGRDCVILIGPEGGLSPDDVALLNVHGYIPVCLGNTTLRATTAAITAVGILGC